MKNNKPRLLAVLFCFLAAPYSAALLAVATDVNLSVVDDTNEGVEVVDITLNPGQADEVTVDNEDGDNEVAISNLEEGDTYTVEVTDSEGNKHRGAFVVPQGGGNVPVQVQPLAPPLLNQQDILEIVFGVGFLSNDALAKLVGKSKDDFTSSFPSAQATDSVDDDAGFAEIIVRIATFAEIWRDFKKVDKKEANRKLRMLLELGYGDPEFDSSEIFDFPNGVQFIGNRTLEVTWFKLGLVLIRQINEAWSAELVAGAAFNRAETSVRTFTVVNGQVVDTVSDQVVNKTVSPYFGLGVSYDFTPAQPGGWSLGANLQWSELKIEDPILRGRTFEDDSVSVGVFLRYGFPLN